MGYYCPNCYRAMTNPLFHVSGQAMCACGEIVDLTNALDEQDLNNEYGFDENQSKWFLDEEPKGGCDEDE